MQFEPISSLSISTNGLNLIKKFEEFRPQLYNDGSPDVPVTNKNKSKGHATIGFGHLVHYGIVDSKNPKEKPYRDNNNNLISISKEKALKLLKEDVKHFERVVKRLVKVHVNQNMYDALVSLVFNIGEGNAKGSTFLRLLNQKKYDQVSSKFKLFNKSRGKVMKGLIKRRNEEAKLFEKQ